MEDQGLVYVYSRVWRGSMELEFSGLGWAKVMWLWLAPLAFFSLPAERVRCGRHLAVHMELEGSVGRGPGCQRGLQILLPVLLREYWVLGTTSTLSTSGRLCPVA